MRALGLEARAAQLRYNRRHFLSRCKPVMVGEIVHVVKPRRKILLARKQPKHFRYMPFLRITPFFRGAGGRSENSVVASADKATTARRKAGGCRTCTSLFFLQNVGGNGRSTKQSRFSSGRAFSFPRAR